ncbi:MAG: molecular chaperone DnaJ [Ruminococcaceae bacterium]|nr:molecular chaperone DnaJ [Oscillospiraceae bacterium]
MSNNPYKVLGVSPSADDEEIKKAYRELVRKYHPDRYSDSDLADLANEKMKEINAAYEEITRMREEAASGGNYYEEPKSGYTSAGNTQSGGKERGYGQNMGGGTNYHSQSYSADAKAKFTAIRNYINGGNIREAERLLDEVEQADRGAEWVFLLGCIQLHKGFYVDAQRSFETAYRMEPTNNEYWQFKERMHQKAGGFGRGYRTSEGDGGCDMCTTLICADCCCECMGGDLIPCC